MRNRKNIDAWLDDVARISGLDRLIIEQACLEAVVDLRDGGAGYLNFGSDGSFVIANNDRKGFALTLVSVSSKTKHSASYPNVKDGWEEALRGRVHQLRNVQALMDAMVCGTA
jgi:hypothetical protein